MPVNLLVTYQSRKKALAKQQATRHGRGQGHPVPLHQRGEHQPGADAGEREVDEPGRQALDLPVDHGQEDAAEDEGEHGGELRAEAEPPDGEPEQEDGDGVEGVLLHEGGERHGRHGTDRPAPEESSILTIRPLALVLSVLLATHPDRRGSGNYQGANPKC